MGGSFFAPSAPALAVCLWLWSLLLLWPVSSSHGFFITTTTTTTTTTRTTRTTLAKRMMSSSTNTRLTTFMSMGNKKGKLLVLGGSGFLGQTVCRRAVMEGYAVTSLSRRGKPTTQTGIDEAITTPQVLQSVDYRIGDARDKSVIESILLQENGEGGGYVGIIHCIGLLFDNISGIGNLNRFVSGSGSVPDDGSSYDDITRLTAFNAIEAAEAYIASTTTAAGEDTQKRKSLPFVFTSAAEAGWPDVIGGSFVENKLAPEWLKRYLAAKRAVEQRLLQQKNISDDESLSLRPVIFRPSLIYSFDRLASLPPVGAFYIGNRIGLPFVDRPVTVQALSSAMIRAIGDESVTGVQRYMEIDQLSRR